MLFTVATLANSQLVCLPPVGINNMLMLFEYLSIIVCLHWSWKGHIHTFYTNHKNYNFLACDWFKKVLFSTNSLAKSWSDSLCFAVLWIVCYWTVWTARYCPRAHIVFYYGKRYITGLSGAQSITKICWRSYTKRTCVRTSRLLSNWGQQHSTLGGYKPYETKSH